MLWSGVLGSSSLLYWRQTVLTASSAPFKSPSPAPPSSEEGLVMFSWDRCTGKEHLVSSGLDMGMSLGGPGSAFHKY